MSTRGLDTSSPWRSPARSPRRRLAFRANAAEPALLGSPALAARSVWGFTVKLAVSLVLLCATAALVAAGAGSAPRQTLSKWYWTPPACEQKLQPSAADHGVRALIVTADGRAFHAAQVVCVGSGGQQTCARTADSLPRLLRIHGLHPLCLGRCGSLLLTRHAARPRYPGSSYVNATTAGLRLEHQAGHDRGEPGPLQRHRGPDRGPARAAAERERLRPTRRLASASCSSFDLREHSRIAGRRVCCSSAPSFVAETREERPKRSSISASRRRAL